MVRLGRIFRSPRFVRYPVYALLLAVLLLPFFIGTQAPVQASNGNGVCEEGEVCFYENNDYNEGATDHLYDWGALEGQYDSDFADNNWYNSSDGMDDETSSIFNNSECDLAVWEDAEYGGASDEFDAGQSDGYMENNAVGDNSVSSFRITYCPD